MSDAKRTSKGIERIHEPVSPGGQTSDDLAVARRTDHAVLTSMPVIAIFFVREVPMAFLSHVVRATYEKGFCIHLTFNDGTEASVDFEAWLSGPVFEPLKRAPYFRKFFLDGGTVAWPNGADIAPETLYHAAQATRSNPALRQAVGRSGRRRG
jgi:hypothetical protein